MLAVAAAAGALIMIASLVACNAMWAPGPWSEHTQPPVDQLDLSTVWSERAHQELQIEICRCLPPGGVGGLAHQTSDPSIRILIFVMVQLLRY